MYRVRMLTESFQVILVVREGRRIEFLFTAKKKKKSKKNFMKGKLLLYRFIFVRVYFLLFSYIRIERKISDLLKNLTV